MFSACFYLCISCNVTIQYSLIAVFDRHLLRFNKSVIYSFSMPMSICNRFHERLASNGKITTFTGVPLFDAIVRRFP